MNPIIVHWTSADGEYVAIDLDKVPRGVGRSGAVYSKENPLLYLSEITNPSNPFANGPGTNPHDGHFYWAIVRKRDLNPSISNAPCDVIMWSHNLPAVSAKPTKKIIPKYPHACPHCKGPAYMGIVPGSRVDCERKCEGSAK